MAVNLKFKAKEEIPAEHLSLCPEREDAWVLDVHGTVDKSKPDEFRTTNATLLKQRDDLKKRFEGIDTDFVGAAAPAALVATEVWLLRLHCFGSADTDVVAHWLVGP